MRSTTSPQARPSREAQPQPSLSSSAGSVSSQSRSLDTAPAGAAHASGEEAREALGGIIAAMDMLALWRGKPVMMRELGAAMGRGRRILLVPGNHDVWTEDAVETETEVVGAGEGEAFAPEGSDADAPSETPGDEQGESQ